MPGSNKSKSKPNGRVLIIAGSDSGGGAGIQGDIKTVTCLGGYAATAITALTAQNTLGVFGIHDVPEKFIAQQLALVLEDIGAGAFNTGMLHKESMIKTIASIIKSYPKIPFVLDPVMFAKGGAQLLETSALETLKTQLIPLAHIITPNVPEAEFLSGITIKDIDGMRESAKIIMGLGCKAILLKGGHMDGEEVIDLLVTQGDETIFMQKRVNTTHTHGTGCALASAIATGIAQKLPLEKAVERARKYVLEAIVTAPCLGNGNGPLNHGHTIRNFL